ncbi:hypothetical protein A2715_04100 [Candidatus Woesebacteria bacterium RIFCSPHIGHO2_01_FULL_39_32]|uniref:DUF7768 domain-containing protein n=2 Tax=Candidatus Woeseibacteriota TaxID=1752722 RepID=A0A0G0PQF8_9BACT|nr:MAG: hypothetical protein UT61_C0013G0027 [Candidatus Woesebacteria bacterium GW2011_GWA1_39_8]OGM03545.1 MAG: hypothetical protein A2124_02880 [Candidatus Woesebacteria bacterium GWB1_37_5]OGM25203.1 MAG: hypothetical protein A2715_04100 [Candidatus Woesebacteria bacterium RIFCSPHIGHO2_01_FULL_39_32]OGM37703.1 MAG: hypothetical protein A3F01_01305 [Candidatus Woesebacteria bacterium RIFCSPHIGHO2_12_FULL_38_11]OGM64735.1 MAG: hypothetical protein A2893_03710 [Candidatus Woesebacteria bacteri
MQSLQKSRKFDTQRKVVFAAMSKKTFYLREHIIKYILEEGYTPTCAFMMFSYFLLDTVDRKALIDANNDLIRRSDELWVFGEMSDGVKEEVNLAKRIGIPIHYFRLSNSKKMFTPTKSGKNEMQ